LKHGLLKIAQSAAIESYFASIAPKFSGLTAQQRAVDQNYACIKEDILAGCAKPLFAKGEKDLEGFKAHLEKWFGLLETMLPESGFVHGLEFPTTADCAVLNCTTGYMPFLASFKLLDGFSLDAYPKVKALAERTNAAIPSFPFAGITDGNPWGM
jgi:glutathione S-transferase